VFLPLLVIMIIDEAEVTFPRPDHIRSLLMAVPTLAALFGGPVLTGLIAMLTLGDHLLLTFVQRDESPLNDEIEVASLGLVCGLITGFCYIRDRQQRKLEEVRSVSEVAQRVVLRPLPPRVGPLRIASAYLAAAAEARIGGDLYAATRTAHSTRLIVGDVRGKGLTSIGDAALLLCTFREAARRHISLHRLVAHLDDSVYRNVTEFAETDADAAECFVTAAVVEVPDDEPTIRLIDCGHPPPLLLRDGRVLTLHPAHTGPPLGLGELAPSEHRDDTFSFEPGDILLLYTDGVLEARDRDGRFYPFAERVRRWRGNAPDALVRYLRDDLLTHVHQRLSDDAALVAIQRTPPAPDAPPPGGETAAATERGEHGPAADRTRPRLARCPDPTAT
jgi:serine phosphatase RsbU (regulator of sigma subunit)